MNESDKMKELHNKKIKSKKHHAFKPRKKTGEIQGAIIEKLQEEYPNVS